MKRYQQVIRAVSCALFRHGSHRLAFRLQMCVLLAGLPSLLIGALVIALLYDATVVSTERGAAVAAHHAMNMLDRVMSDRYGDAEVFANLPAVRMLDRTRLSAVVNQCVTTYAPYYGRAMIVDRTGEVLAANNVDASGRTMKSELVGFSVAGEPWFQEAMADRQRVAIYDSDHDPLRQDSMQENTPGLIFARAIKDDGGNPSGVWAVRFIVGSLGGMFKETGSQHPESASYPLVLKTRSGAPLLTVGEAGIGKPIVTITSPGFARWPGGRWVMESYLPREFVRKQWLVIGFGGGVVIFFAAAGEVGVSWIVRRHIIQPLQELEAKVRLIKADPQSVSEGSASASSPSPSLLQQRKDELGDIARLLDAQTQEMQRHVRQLAQLNDSSQRIQEQVMSLPALLERLLHTAKILTGARYAALGLFGETGQQPVKFLTEGIDEETKQRIGILPSGRGLLGALGEKEGVLRLKDLTRHAQSVGFPPHHPAMRSFLGVSIRAHGKLFGRLYLTDKAHEDSQGHPRGSSAEDVEEFTHRDEQFIAALAYQAGTAIETASLIEEIRTTQSRDRALLDSVEEGIYGIDLAGRCLFVNRSGAAILQYAADELVGRLMHPLLHPAREDGTACPEAECPLSATMRRIQGCRLEDAILWRKDGTSFPAMYAATPLRDGTGTVMGAVAIFSDLSERRALEQQVRQGQKMEALGQLAAGVAHDFNNLLTIMKGNSDLVLLQENLTPSSRGRIEEIMKATDRAALLTGQLLAFGRKKPIERKRVAIHDVIRGIESLLRRLVGEGIDFQMKLAEGRWFATIDSGGLEQVLINLAVNARDAMPAGGRLDIRSAIVGGEDLPGLPSPQKPVDPVIQITVSDSGVGMDEPTQARIFEPFFTTKSVGRGTGLGLATVYRIITENEGAIHVASKPGAGTVFTLVLPLAAPPEELPVEPLVTPPIRGGDETILLVEDDQTVRTRVRTVLESKGYHVVAAKGGRQAARVARGYEGAIALLLFDAVMPDMSGAMLVRSLRVHRPDLKVLFIAGAQAGDGVSEGEVLPKPFTNETLLETVRRVLDQPVGPLPLRNAAHEPKRILVIDDDRQVNSMLQAMLESEGYCVSSASNGSAGIALLRQEVVNLLITDVLMADMDGLEVVQEVRRLWPSLKIIAMSGGGIGVVPGTYLSVALRLGATSSLVKPFSHEQLIRVVRELLE